jgi:carbamoyl-phosphate synthase large subunit
VTTDANSACQAGVTVLATSVGNDGFPSVLAAWRDNGERAVRVVGVDTRAAAAGLRLADEAAVVPPRQAAEDLVTALLAVCRRYGVRVLYPLSTEDQEFYAERVATFAAAGVAVATSAVPALRVANDKAALLERCAAAGVPCPEWLRVGDLGELEAGARKLGWPAQPFVLKLDRGTGAQGVKIVDAGQDPYARLFDRDNLRVWYEDVLAGLRGLVALPPMHLAEYLPGQEYSVDVLCWRGRADAVVVRERLATLYGLATHAVVVDHPEAAATAARVVELLGLSYVVNVQLRCDAAGTPRLLEVNPRIPGTIGLTVAAGVNMPYLALKRALGEPLDPVPPAVVGTELVRYWNTAVRHPDVAR